MRVTSPAVTVKTIWDALVAEYGAADTYGLLLETNLDAKISEAKADLTTLEAAIALNLDAKVSEAKADVSALATAAALTAAKAVIDAIVIDTAGIAGDAMRGTDSAALASAWTAALATILGNFSAARIGYLDNINQAGLLQLTAARAVSLEFMGRALEGYTPIIGYPGTHDTTYVTVLDITGRGILNSIGSEGYGGGAVTTIVKLTLDGGVVIDEANLFSNKAGEKIVQSWPLFLAFDTSCLLEMKYDTSGADVHFIGVASVE